MQVAVAGPSPDQPAPIRIHHHLPLAPFDLLARIIAPRPSALGGLDRLAVEHGGTRRGLTPDPLAIGHDGGVIDGLEQARIAPVREPAVHSGPRRQILGKEPPSHATPQHVEDRVQDFAKRPGPWSPTLLRLWHERLDQSPLGISQVGFVAQVLAAMLPPGGWGPHRGSKRDFDPLPESRLLRPLNPFRSGLLATTAAALARPL